MPEARTRRRHRRIRIGLAGIAALGLTAASAGGAMGWMIGGTTATIAEYKSRPVASVPRAGSHSDTGIAPVTTRAVMTAEASGSASPIPAKAWFPENNTVQWATAVAPGQQLSGISLRNGDQAVNLIAHLTARGTTGGMVPVASMTVSPGREAVLHPPAGDYAMEIVTSPVDMPYERVGTLPRSKPASFTLPTQDQNAIPTVRFEVSQGVIRRLPDPTAGSTRIASEIGSAGARSRAKGRMEIEEYASGPEDADFEEG